MSLKWYSLFLMLYFVALIWFTIPTLLITFATVVFLAAYLAYEALKAVVFYAIVGIVSLLVGAVKLGYNMVK